MTIAAFGTPTSQTASIGTEHFLANVNEAGVYTFHVDMNALAAGDYLELRIYQIVLTGGTARVVYLETFQGGDIAVREEKIFISVPISNELTDTNSLRFSLKQTLGTGRSFPWKVLKHS